MISKIIGATLITLALLFPACTFRETRPPAMPAPEKSSAVTTELSSSPGWQKEWDKLVAAAKKEGNLIIYSTAGPQTRDFITEAFENKYGIKVSFIQGRGALITTRLFQERNAGIYMADVFLGGNTTGLTILKPAGALDSLKPYLFLPEAIDTQAWYGGRLPFVDKEGTVLAFSQYVNQPLIINTHLVKKDEIASFRDLLNPKWKGKISLGDPTIPGGDLNWFSVVGEMMGFDFMRELARQQPLFTPDARLKVEWLAKEKVAITNTAKNETVEEFIKAGAPLMNISVKEGDYLSTSSGNVSIINRPAHPEAARVFVNWLLTREGQTVASKGLTLPSRRTDVPTEHINQDMLVKTGRKYIESDSEEFVLKKDKYRERAAEIFGALMR